MNAIRFARRASALALTSTLLAACGSPTGDDHDEPDVAGVTITLGNNTVELGPSGQSGTLTLVSGTSSAVSIRVLNAAGTDDPVVVADAADYEIRMRQGASNRFTASGTGYPYTGTITPAASTGQAVYTVEVYSKDHAHVEWTGQLTLTVTSGGVQ